MLYQHPELATHILAIFILAGTVGAILLRITESYPWWYTTWVAITGGTATGTIAWLTAVTYTTYEEFEIMVFSNIVRQRDRKASEEVWQRIESERQKIAEQAELLAQQNQELVERDQELVERDQELVEKGQELSERDQELVERDQELTSQKQELAERERAIAEKEEELARREQNLAQE